MLMFPMRFLLVPLAALSTCGAPAETVDKPACTGTIVEIAGDGEVPCDPSSGQVLIRINATYPCDLQGGDEVTALNGTKLCVDIDY